MYLIEFLNKHILPNEEELIIGNKKETEESKKNYVCDEGGE